MQCNDILEEHGTMSKGGRRRGGELLALEYVGEREEA